MNSNNHKTSRVLQFLPFVLFFLLGTFYLYYYTAYIFFYQEKSLLFLTSLSYVIQHLNQPGGFLIYLGELQTTFYFYPLIGALTVTLEICGIIFLIQKIGKVLSSRIFYFLPFLIGAVLFYLQSNYQFQAFNNIGILIQLVLLYRIVSYSKREYLWIPVFLSPVFYFLFGSFSLLFFILFILFLLQKREWMKLFLTLILTSIFFFVGKYFLFFQTTVTLIQYPFSEQDIGGQIKLFAAVIGIIGFLPLLLNIEIRQVSALAIRNIKLIEFIPLVILILLTVLIVPRIDKKNSHYFHVEKLFYEQKYEELIRFNSQFPSTNILTAFLNNVALAETGQLTNALFSYPQTPDGSTLFLKWEIISEVLKRGGYFYFNIGMVNEAQRWAYEYMVMQGNSPEALKMMIKTDLIKGKYAIAQKYISVLEKSVFYRKDAAEFKKMLFNEKEIDADIELGRKKVLDTKQDFFVQTETPVSNLDLIIAADSTNIPAIEYKLAWLMLQKDMKGIVAMLPLMEKAGYKQIPKNVEEVVVSYKLMRVGEMPELKILEVSKQTEQRFQQFYKKFQQNRSNKQQAQSALANDYSNTYWYYVFFR